MSYTVFLGNLPAWVTADDIRSWLQAENLVADAVKVIRNPETQESKGFAFIDAPNSDEMNAIIRRFDRAPLEDRILRANRAQPPRPKGQVVSGQAAPAGQVPAGQVPAGQVPAGQVKETEDRARRGGKKHRKSGKVTSPKSAFAQELAKAL